MKKKTDIELKIKVPKDIFKLTEEQKEWFERISDWEKRGLKKRGIIIKG